MDHDLQVMRAQTGQRAGTEETQATRESSRGNSGATPTRESSQLISASTVTSPQAATLASQQENQPPEIQQGLPRQNLPRHDPIHVVFEEFLHDQDLPIYDPSRVQELEIENPEDLRIKKYLGAYHQLTEEDRAKVPFITTPYRQGDTSRGSSATNPSSRSKVTIREESAGTRSRSPIVTEPRPARVRSLTAPRSHEPGSTLQNTQATRESSRNDMHVDLTVGDGPLEKNLSAQEMPSGF